jgi:hypothetical protein
VTPALRILAGTNAYRMLQEQGLRASLFRLMVGASGGPKWLVLGGLDRALAGGWLAAQREHPLSLLGSSIGAWRLTCHAMSSPLAALDRFEAAYLDQRYSRKPAPAEVSAVSRRILGAVLGAAGAGEVLANPAFRLAVVTARSRHLAAAEARGVQALGLAAAGFANALHRRALGGFYRRALFVDPRDRESYAAFPEILRHTHPLTLENLAPVVLASGSIPLVLEGVREIPGAPPGVYRDGGITDYHFDLSFAPGGGLILYPHFYAGLTPGWFDKSLRWRRVGAAALANTVILCPSRAFVDRLPGGRIPDRSDFVECDDQTRLSRWRRVIGESRRLGDEFLALADGDAVAARVEKIDTGP